MIIDLTNEGKHDAEEPRDHGLRHGSKQASKLADEAKDDSNDGSDLNHSPAPHPRDLHCSDVFLHIARFLIKDLLEALALLKGQAI